MIAGKKDVIICNECVKLAADIINAEKKGMRIPKINIAAIFRRFTRMH
jgi:ATP-dependent protease Clp ATPase subunit